MATVKRNAAVTKTETVEVTPAQIVLTLTEGEATAVKAILGGITGDSSGPIRSLTSKVYRALHSAGVDQYNSSPLRNDIIQTAKTTPPVNPFAW